MKTDLDKLMQAEDLAAILITGPSQHNPSMYYMIGTCHLVTADLIKPINQEAVLFYNPMERDEAASTGLQTKNLVDYDMKAMIKEAGGDRSRATAFRYKQMLIDLGVSSGKISIHGKIDLDPMLGILKNLEEMMPEIEIIRTTPGNSIMQKAMSTKDAQEIDRIRRMGAITTEVVGATANYLSSHTAKNGVLVKKDGTPLTIGEVKRKISLLLVERNVEASEGFIFAIGRDAGVPHSTGKEDDLLALGKTIVFDIFPHEKGGGYFYDFTRTWCLGYAPPKVEALYDDVRTTYETIMTSLKVNGSTSQYQEKTCDLFEKMGHTTIRQDRGVTSGYVHSLGHGIGLKLHEAPSFPGKGSGAPAYKLSPGSVVTIEPGLYYPDQEMGIRLEDTIAVHADGTIEILAEYPLDLVIPINQA